MRESRSLGSVRGALGNQGPYRDPQHRGRRAKRGHPRAKPREENCRRRRRRSRRRRPRSPVAKRSGAKGEDYPCRRQQPAGIATVAAPQGAVRAVTTRSQDRPRCLPQQRDSAFACKAKADERDPLPKHYVMRRSPGAGVSATSMPPRVARPCPSLTTRRKLRQRVRRRRRRRPARR